MPNTDPYNIQTAELDDLPKILDLQKESFMAEAELYQDFSIPPLHQTLESLKEEFKKGVVLKLTFHGKIIGSVRGFENDGTCYINKLIVSPDFQNKGLGNMLMKSIESKFPSAKRFELFTGFKSEKNLHIYKKLGYKEIRRKQVGPTVVLVFMEKEIPQVDARLN